MSREVKIVVKKRSLTPQKQHGTKTICRETNSIILSNSAALWTYKYWPKRVVSGMTEEFKMQKFHRLVCDPFLFDFFFFFKHINFFFFAIRKTNPTKVEHHQISRLWATWLLFHFCSCISAFPVMEGSSSKAARDLHAIKSLPTVCGRGWWPLIWSNYLSDISVVVATAKAA